MQAVTHMAVGAALAVAIAGREDAPRRRPRIAAAAVLAGLSHVLLDDLAGATYHPPDPLWGDPFWVGFHLLVAVATVAIAWRCRRLWLPMAAALTPDLDWIIGRPLGLWEPGTVHGLFREVPGLATVSEALRGVVPDLRAEPAAALSEVVLVGVLWAYVTWAGVTPAPTKARAAVLPEGAGGGTSAGPPGGNPGPTQTVADGLVGAGFTPARPSPRETPPAPPSRTV